MTSEAIKIVEALSEAENSLKSTKEKAKEFSVKSISRMLQSKLYVPHYIQLLQ